jgi:hypothetical protein
MGEKTKQHYVVESYLKGWATKGQLWARRSGKVFLTSTDNVAQSRYFYELEPLSEAEVGLVRRLVDTGPEINRLTNASSLNKYLELANSDEPRTSLESYYSEVIEGESAPIIETLRIGNSEVLLDKKAKICLCIYLGHQHVRTKKMRSEMEKVAAATVLPDGYVGINLNKVLAAQSFVLANSIGSILLSRLHMQLVENTSGERLITSDQPICNLLAIEGSPPTGTSFYIPLSPRFSLWATEAPNEQNIDSEDRVRQLNAFMANNSLELVFASKREDLSQID